MNYNGDMSKLYFRYGAMGCGKTMQLLQVAFNYEERGHKVCVIKPATDTKNGTKLLTRIGPERETNFCFDRKTNLYNIISKLFVFYIFMKSLITHKAFCLINHLFAIFTIFDYRAYFYTAYFLFVTRITCCR